MQYHIASESSFQRVLRAHGQNAHQGRSRAPQPTRTATTHIATAPGQVWCWDMTYLPTQVQGQWFYLYLIMDLYSRMIVSWEIHATDDADHAVALLKRTALAEGVHSMPDKPMLHGDNGIRYVTPAQRHAGKDNAILAAHHQVYLRAREKNPLAGREIRATGHRSAL